jgi:hypothetical protein
MAEILRAHPEVQAQEKTETLSCVFIHPQTVNMPKSSYSQINTQKLLNALSEILSERSGKQIKVKEAT